MTENEFGAQYQPCSGVAFVGFDSDYHPICMLTYSLSPRFACYGAQNTDSADSGCKSQMESPRMVVISAAMCYDAEPEAGALHILSRACFVFVPKSEKQLSKSETQDIF